MLGRYIKWYVQFECSDTATSRYAMPAKSSGMVQNGLLELPRCVQPKQSSAAVGTITMMSVSSLV